MNPVHDNPEPVSAGSLVPDVVSEIPVAAQGAAQKPADDDDELDSIMRDVGKDIKEIGKKKPKRHWFAHDKKPKTDPKFSARPINQVMPVPAAAPAIKPAPAAKAAPAPAPAAAKPAVKKAPKPPKTSRAPVGVIMMAVVITGGLIAAAYYAYK